MKINGEREPWDTPCRGICTASALGDDVCKGCGRTRTEVAEWIHLSREQRIKINQRLQSGKNYDER